MNGLGFGIEGSKVTACHLAGGVQSLILCIKSRLGFLLPATLSILLTYSMVRWTQPRNLSTMENELWSEGLMWLIGVVACLCPALRSSCLLALAVMATECKNNVLLNGSAMENALR